jgi:hypothetical protein
VVRYLVKVRRLKQRRLPRADEHRRDPAPAPRGRENQAAGHQCDQGGSPRAPQRGPQGLGHGSPHRPPQPLPPPGSQGGWSPYSLPPPTFPPPPLDNAPLHPLGAHVTTNCCPSSTTLWSSQPWYDTLSFPSFVAGNAAAAQLPQ